jgi:mono/diheme cytochrome c family protein
MGNRKWVFISAIGVLAALVGQGIYADFKSGNDTAVSTQPARQAMPAAPSAVTAPAGTTYNVGPNAAYSPDLADGDGREEVAYNCGLCHGLSYITMRPPISAEGWAREVNMMRGFYGASISDSTAQKIVRYLATHYTPETLKR